MEVCSIYSENAGDRVVVDHAIEGVVVFCPETDSYADDLPISEWPTDTYSGPMVREEYGAGLVFRPTECFIGDNTTLIEWDRTSFVPG